MMVACLIKTKERSPQNHQCYHEINKHRCFQFLVLIKTIVSIWRENMLGYLSADVIDLF